MKQQIFGEDRVRNTCLHLRLTWYTGTCRVIWRLSLQSYPRNFTHCFVSRSYSTKYCIAQTRRYPWGIQWLVSTYQGKEGGGGVLPGQNRVLWQKWAKNVHSLACSCITDSLTHTLRVWRLINTEDGKYQFHDRFQISESLNTNAFWIILDCWPGNGPEPRCTLTLLFRSGQIILATLPEVY